MQGARGSGEGAAGIGVDGGGEKVDRGILVFIGTAGAVRAESGRRGSGQAGHGSGAAQAERIAGTAECGSRSDLRASGGGTFGDGGERGGGAASVVWIERAGAEPVDSRDVRLDGTDPVFHGGGAGSAGVDDSKGSDGSEGGGGDSQRHREGIHTRGSGAME